MSVLPTSYGTAAGVANYTPAYAPTGVFDTTTKPSLSAVESWVNQTSKIVDAALMSFRFDVPITNSDCILMLTPLVEQAVSEQVLYTNSAGRFFSGDAPPSGTVADVIRKSIYAWVKDNASGLENSGATRNPDDVGADNVAQFGSIGLNFGARGGCE